MVQPRRLARIEKRIQQKIAQVLLRDASDPRLGFVTITRVTVDAELHACKVYWSVIGDDNARALNESALQHARKFIQHEVADVLETRNVPTLHFLFDESIQGAERINEILRDIDQKQPQRDEPSEPEDQPESDPS